MSVAYFQQKADEATAQYVRDYWLRRKEGAEALERQLAAQAKRNAIEATMTSNMQRFRTMAAPFMSLESKHPHGVIVRWEKPENWDPDDYIVLVREKGAAEWRSVASAPISSETRKMVVPRRYLAWGEYREPYEITVAAVWDGVGRKLACPKYYPPQFEVRHPSSNVAHEHQVEPPEVAEEQAETLTRMERIVQAVLSYEGRRTRDGRPWVRPLRRHAAMPNITTDERNEAYRRAQ